jgi:hypothetical protein
MLIYDSDRADGLNKALQTRDVIGQAQGTWSASTSPMPPPSRCS